jgi:hypothetical protein
MHNTQSMHPAPAPAAYSSSSSSDPFPGGQHAARANASHPVDPSTRTQPMRRCISSSSLDANQAASRPAAAGRGIPWIEYMINRIRVRRTNRWPRRQHTRRPSTSSSATADPIRLGATAAAAFCRPACMVHAPVPPLPVSRLPVPSPAKRLQSERSGPRAGRPSTPRR